jgi:hypothetical protein
MTAADIRQMELRLNKAAARWELNDPPRGLAIVDRRAIVLDNLRRLERARTSKGFERAVDELLHSCHAVRRGKNGFGPRSAAVLLKEPALKFGNGNAIVVLGVASVIYRLAPNAFEEHKQRWLGRLDVLLFEWRWPTAGEMEEWTAKDASIAADSISKKFGWLERWFGRLDVLFSGGRWPTSDELKEWKEIDEAGFATGS